MRGEGLGIPSPNLGCHRVDIIYKPSVLAVSCSVSWCPGSTADSCSYVSLRCSVHCVYLHLYPAVTVRYCVLLRCSRNWDFGEMKGCFRLVRQRVHGWRQSFCPSIPGILPMRQWPRSSSTMELSLDLLVMTHLALCSLRLRQVHGSVCTSRCIPF